MVVDPLAAPELAPEAPRSVAPTTGQQARADLALFVVVAIWGATFVMIKDALGFAGPLTFLASRFTLAVAVVLPVFLSRRVRARATRRGLVVGLLAGALVFVGFVFQTVGLQFTTPARAAFITGLCVVLVPLFQALFWRHPIGPGTWGGVALAALGLAFLALGPDLLSGGPLLRVDTLVGDALVFGCAVAFACHILFLGHLAPRHDTLLLTTAQLGAAALLGVLCALMFERPALVQLAAILPAAAFTGVFATGLAFAIQTRAQRFTSPVHAALIFSLEPVFGGLFAYLLIGEVLGPLALAGCGLILTGMIAAQVADLRAAPRS